MTGLRLKKQQQLEHPVQQHMGQDGGKQLIRYTVTFNVYQVALSANDIAQCQYIHGGQLGLIKLYIARSPLFLSTDNRIKLNFL